MTQKTAPRNRCDRFYRDLLLTCRYHGRVKIFLSGAIVEVGIAGTTAVFGLIVVVTALWLSGRHDRADEFYERRHA